MTANQGQQKSGGRGGFDVSFAMDDLTGKAPSDPRKMALALVLAVILETIVLGGAYVGLSLYKEGFEGRLGQARVDARQIEQSAGEIVVAVRNAETYARQLTAARSALDRHVAWTRLFDLIETLARPGTRFSQFNGSTMNGVVGIDASARSYRDMAEQIVALREHPLVESVRASSASAQVNDLGEVQGVAFAMTIKFKAEAWKRVVE